MNDTAGMAHDQADRVPGPRQVIDAELADQLLGRAQAEGVELLGPDGLLSQVTRAVLERTLAEEMTGHLGYVSRRGRIDAEVIRQHEASHQTSKHRTSSSPARPR